MIYVVKSRKWAWYHVLRVTEDKEGIVCYKCGERMDKEYVWKWDDYDDVMTAEDLLSYSQGPRLSSNFPR